MKVQKIKQLWLISNLTNVAEEPQGLSEHIVKFCY